MPGRRHHAVLRRADGIDRRSATSSSATSRAPATRPRAMPRASGRVGVAIATSGPGATNLVTAIADAYMDSVPMIAITGQVFSTSMGTDAFQEVDIVGITMPITKHSFLVTDPADVPATPRRGVPDRHDRPPRPGARRHHQGRAAEPRRRSSGRRSSTCPATVRSRRRTASRSAAAAELLAEAKRPVLYVGGGVIRAGAPSRAARARRDDRRAGRHDADGARRVPRLAPAAPRHAGHARHGARGARAAGGRPASSRSAPGSTTA